MATRKNTSMLVKNECGKFGKGQGLYYIGPIALILNRELLQSFKNTKQIADNIWIGEPKI